MNKNIYIICVAAAVLFAGPASADSTATIHGEVYGWDTFEPLEYSVVEVNSTPSQSMVAKYGLYSFELEPGDYLIKASYYQNSTLIYSAEKTVKVVGEGSYVYDLLLLPVYSEELMDSSEERVISENPIDTEINNPDADNVSADNVSITEPGEINGSSSSTGYYMLAALVLSLFLAGGYRFQKNKSIEENKLEKNKPEKYKLEKRQIEKSQLEKIQMEKNRLPEEKPEEETKKLSLPEIEPATPEQEAEQDKETSPEEPAQASEPTKIPEPETPIMDKNYPLPADLEEIMDIIRGQGGRITQKDLRSKLKYSEGKVSLMLADLERRELIEKFKRGRGNVVILRDEGR